MILSVEIIKIIVKKREAFNFCQCFKATHNIQRYATGGLTGSNCFACARYLRIGRIESERLTGSGAAILL